MTQTLAHSLQRRTASHVVGTWVPEPPAGIPAPLQGAPHSFANGLLVVSSAMLAERHHEYGLVQLTA